MMVVVVVAVVAVVLVLVVAAAAAAAVAGVAAAAAVAIVTLNVQLSEAALGLAEVAEDELSGEAAAQQRPAGREKQVEAGGIHHLLKRLSWCFAVV